MRSMLRWSRHRRDNGERGAILVESVLILPIFLLLVFGVVEFSISFWSTAMIEDAARHGGRAASHVAHQPDYEEQIAEVVVEDVRRLPGTATPLFLIVYKANDNGYPGNPDNVNWVAGVQQCSQPAAQTCTLMAWDPETREFSLVEGAVPELGIGATRWDPATHEFCPYSEDGIDRIGIAVAMTYKPLLSMFQEFLERDNTNFIVRSSVLSFEPGPTAVCGGP